MSETLVAIVGLLLVMAVGWKLKQSHRPLYGNQLAKDDLEKEFVAITSSIQLLHLL